MKVVRKLREDPWESVRLIAKRIIGTPLIMMMFHSITLFHPSPLSALKLQKAEMEAQLQYIRERIAYWRKQEKDRKLKSPYVQ